MITVTFKAIKEKPAILLPNQAFVILEVTGPKTPKGNVKILAAPIRPYNSGELIHINPKSVKIVRSK